MCCLKLILVSILIGNCCSPVNCKILQTISFEQDFKTLRLFLYFSSVEGTSDDLDVPIKKIFENPDFVKKHNVCSINSINWARICTQIVHYIYCYFQCRQNSTENVKIIVPTGACGNVSGSSQIQKIKYSFMVFFPSNLPSLPLVYIQ